MNTNDEREPTIDPNRGTHICFDGDTSGGQVSSCVLCGPTSKPPSGASITPTELAEWRAVVEKATPGPWEREASVEYIPSEQKHYIEQWVMDSDGKRLFDADTSDLVLIDRDDEGNEYDLNAHNNLMLAAVARTVLPRLIDEVEAGRRDAEKFLQFESENYDLRSQLHEAELNASLVADQLREAQGEVKRLTKYAGDLELVVTGKLK